jgi:polysaccharide export outer membrane protein
MFLRGWSSNTALALLLLIALAASCCCFDNWEFPEFKDLRRPQVLTEWHWDELIDYDCSPIVEEECGPLFDPVETAPARKNNDYILAQGDFLEMAVFGDEETVVDGVVVAPDGMIYYTFVEEVPAAGKTAVELGEDLERRLSDLFINPVVTITPKTSVDKNYKILGRVEKPGVYVVRDRMTLVDTIAQAGGFLKEVYRENDKSNDIAFLADLKHSFILRDGQKLPVDFEELVFKGNKDYNIEVKSGDYIYIASTGTPAVYVLGAIRNPQRVRYIKGIRLTQAIAQVTGWSSGLINQTSGFGGGIVLGSSGSGTAFAPDLTRIIVIRGELNNPMVMTVDLTLVFKGLARDLILQPGDIIYASDKTMRFGRELVRLAIDTFVQSFGTTAGAYYGQNVWFRTGGG